jgi:zinc D-Ala-D-Ala carboxypeptidase
MSCKPPTLDPAIPTGGVTLSSSPLENARVLLSTVSQAGGDPTLDEYEENIANGNNTANKSGILLPNTQTLSTPANPNADSNAGLPKQTTLPPPPPEKESAANDKAPPGGNGTPIPGSSWDGSNYDVQLSPNFKLRQMTVNAVFPHPLVDYKAPNKLYTKDERFKALQNLALNILEPMYAKYGKLNITSGLRNQTSGTSSLSQHILGEAADIQFPGWNYARYWEEAQWVKDNIKYDQFIYEHSSSTGLVWFHLSFKASGNRAPDNRTKVMTMYRNNYTPGLKRYG